MLVTIQRHPGKSLLVLLVVIAIIIGVWYFIKNFTDRHDTSARARAAQTAGLGCNISANDMIKFKRQTREWLTEMEPRDGDANMFHKLDPVTQNLLVDNVTAAFRSKCLAQQSVAACKNFELDNYRGQRMASNPSYIYQYNQLGMPINDDGFYVGDPDSKPMKGISCTFKE